MPKIGYKATKEHRENLSKSHQGPRPWRIGKSVNQKENHWNWKGGISEFYRDKHSLMNPEYIEWRKAVFIRDNFKCRIASEHCKGRLEVHHILRYKDYPEERYNVNNGITLCHAHHPRKKKDEAELSPYFQNLVAEMH